MKRIDEQAANARWLTRARGRATRAFSRFKAFAAPCER